MVATYEDILQNNLNFFKQQIEKNVPIDQKTNKRFTVDFNTVNGKFLYSLINTISVAQYNNQRNQEYLFKQFFPQTADYDALREFHGNTWGVTPNDATPATGYVVFTGTEGASIQQASQLDYNSQSYSTEETAVITKNTIKVISLTANQNLATVVLEQDFKLASGMKITSIYGANESQYNKNNFKISVISPNSFTYEVSSDTPATATGNIYIDTISTSVSVTSDDTGKEQNLINGTELQMNVEKEGVDPICHVYYDGIVGGKDKESEEEFRARVLEGTRGMAQGWNRANIKIKIKAFQYGKYSDALIFIPRSENTNGIKMSGYTTIYMLKKDFTPLSTTEAAELKEYLTSSIYSIDPVPGHLEIVSPVMKQIIINVSLINGANTLDMKNAVKETISEMQKDQTVCYFRKNLTKKTITSWLDQIIDLNGTVLEDNYILNAPTEDVVLAYNEFPSLQLTW